MSKQPRSSSGARRLKLKARAQRQEETRARIVRAAVDLHQDVGPLATSISAIAARAGVQRLTVYRHFPDEAALFAACTDAYFSEHPPPDPAAWLNIRDKKTRRHQGLRELYAYWAEAEPMIANVLRDFEVDPIRVGTGTIEYMKSAAHALLARSSAGHASKIERAAAGHAVDFRTWQSLARRHGLTNEQAVRLMAAAIEAASKLRIR